MVNGELHADSWVRISDVAIRLSNGDYLFTYNVECSNNHKINNVR